MTLPHTKLRSLEGAAADAEIHFYRGMKVDQDVRDVYREAFKQGARWAITRGVGKNLTIASDPCPLEKQCAAEAKALAEHDARAPEFPRHLSTFKHFLKPKGD